MDNYIDNVVIKLKRQYSKDELVSVMLKEESQLKIEVGILKSERDELQYMLDKYIKLDKTTKSRVGQMVLYQNMKKEIGHLRDKCKKLKRENEDLFSKLVVNNSKQLK